MIMMAVIVGTALQLGEDGIGSPSAIFLISLSSSFFIAACLHPQEFWCIVPGLIYLLSIPSMYLLLILYSIINLNVVSWGTREVMVKKTKKELEQEKKDAEEARRRAKNKSLLGFLQNGAGNNQDDQGSIEISLAGLFKCMLCTHGKPSDEKQQLVAIAESLEQLGRRIEHIEKAVDPHGHAGGRRRASSVGSRSAGDHLGAIGENPDGENGHDSDTETIDSQNTDRPRENGFPSRPYWLDDAGIKKGEVETISIQEELFWKELLEKYLYPIDDDPTEKARIAKELKDLRDRSVFAFVMNNALFVLIVFLLQLNKDQLHVKWPFGIKTNITYDSTTQEVHVQKEHLQLEPIGLVFVFFFALILVIQFTAMLFHRFGTFAHILASTSLTWGYCKKVRERKFSRDIKKKQVIPCEFISAEERRPVRGRSAVEARGRHSPRSAASRRHGGRLRRGQRQRSRSSAHHTQPREEPQEDPGHQHARRGLPPALLQSQGRGRRGHRPAAQHLHASLHPRLQGPRGQAQQHHGRPAPSLADADPRGEQHLRGARQHPRHREQSADSQQPDIRHGSVRRRAESQRAQRPRRQRRRGGRLDLRGAHQRGLRGRRGPEPAEQRADAHHEPHLDRVRQFESVKKKMNKNVRVRAARLQSAVERFKKQQQQQQKMAEPELKPNQVIAGYFKYQVEFKYRQEWILENYDALTTIRPGMDPRMVIRSQSFYSPCDGSDYEWRLILYPNGLEDKTHVSLFVEYLDDDNVIASVRLSILDAERNSYVEAFVRGKNFHARDRVYGAARLLPKYLLDEPYGVITKNQELHVVCEVCLDHVPKHSRRLLHLTWRAIEFESYARLQRGRARPRQGRRPDGLGQEEALPAQAHTAVAQPDPQDDARAEEAGERQDPDLHRGLRLQDAQGGLPVHLLRQGRDRGRSRGRHAGGGQVAGDAGLGHHLRAVPHRPHLGRQGHGLSAAGRQGPLPEPQAEDPELHRLQFGQSFFKPMKMKRELEENAKSAATKHVINMLQRPGQLEKVEQYKHRIGRKKASVETMLKTAMQSQLDGVKEIEKYKDILQFKKDTGCSSVMIARAAEWNCSIFRSAGLLPIDEVIKSYLKLACDYDNSPSNTKYCIQNILRELQETPLGKRFLDTQTLEQICELWDMGDYCRAKAKEFSSLGYTGRFDVVPERLSQLGGGAAKRKLEEEAGDVLLMRCKFIRNSYPNDQSLPKSQLNKWTRENRKKLPSYTSINEDKLFRAIVVVDGKKYGSTFWEKSKKWAEQGAALVGLCALGVIDEATLTNDGNLLS
ncbi:unnamed protein product [Trichogramma brassicae]|uniref:Chitin synthase n=1 Tax=Trichogramma brassicae TaxID=86971 RepID=A0A6H5HVW2_9HYME|nr:unnamed protein product [Trichogramma brassicae]